MWFPPVWASEIEPYPIAVTKSRFPSMRHLGDISKINGAKIEPVDIITFGSPCQDLSVAGKRTGLNGQRSGLFMEAIRIIKEMREATNDTYPRFAVWENVPGAFSSNKGQDFRNVLEELIRIVEANAIMPNVPKKGWAYADSYRGDGWSIAYRVLDAQYWGVPQRRRRIYLVADFRGQSAGKILFEREGLRGHFTEGRTPWQGITAGTKRSVGVNDFTYILDNIGGQAEYGKASRVNGTLRAGDRGAVAYSLENHPNDSRVSIDENGKVQTLTSRMGTGGGNVPMVMETVALEGNGQRPSHHGDGYVVSDKSYTLNATEVHGVVYAVDQGAGKSSASVTEDLSPTLACTHDGAPAIAIERAFFNQGQNALYEPQTYEDGTNPTLVAKGPSAVCYWDGTQTVGTLTAQNAGGSQRMPDKANFNCVVDEKNYIVRRLTPTECARLQGFPDDWGHIDPKTELTDEDYRFWLEVRNTHAAINGRQTKNYTEKQMLSWYNKLHSDSAEYKLWGNGIALPCALYVMQGIAEITKETN